jgi:hypothetical protein
MRYHYCPGLVNPLTLILHAALVFAPVQVLGALVVATLV